MRMTENCMRMTDQIPVVHDQHAHVLSSNSTDISDALCNSICRTWVCAERDQVFIGNQREQLQKEPAEARSSHINPGGDAMRWALREYGTNGCDVVSHKI